MERKEMKLHSKDINEELQHNTMEILAAMKKDPSRFKKKIRRQQNDLDELNI